MSDNETSDNGASVISAFIATAIIIGTLLIAFFFFVSMDDDEENDGKAPIEMREKG